MAISVVENCDNMEFMSRYPDKFFELAIVDPPYGIGFGKFNRTNKNQNGERFKANKYKNDDWDECTPGDEYFTELLRVSKNQIVWGGNYFIQLAKIETPNLKTIAQFNEYIQESSENWIFWYKQNPVPNFADGELAWISFPQSNQFNFKYFGNIEGNTSASTKHHPTQKPIALYKWLLQNYAQPGDKILDTHLGSQSSRIAAYDMGFDFYGCELDLDYFNAGCKRFDNHEAQVNIFRDLLI